jgi:hypothetical protein
MEERGAAVKWKFSGIFASKLALLSPWCPQSQQCPQCPQSQWKHKNDAAICSGGCRGTILSPPRIAQRFSAGFPRQQSASPVRDERSVLPSPRDLAHFPLADFPALKRWAILEPAGERRWQLRVHQETHLSSSGENWVVEVARRIGEASLDIRCFQVGKIRENLAVIVGPVCRRGRILPR